MVLEISSQKIMYAKYEYATINTLALEDKSIAHVYFLYDRSMPHVYFL